MRALGVLAFLVGAGSTAHADGPIVVRAGLGITGQHSSCGPGPCSAFNWGLGFESDVGYRVMEGFAVGAHLGIRTNSGTETEGSNSHPPIDVYHVDYMSLHLGVGAQVSTDRVWFAPWLGVDESGVAGGTNADRRRNLAFGFAGGADLYISPTGHRVGAYLGLVWEPQGLGAQGSPDLYLAAGIQYRYW